MHFNTKETQNYFYDLNPSPFSLSLSLSLSLCSEWILKAATTIRQSERLRVLI